MNDNDRFRISLSITKGDQRGTALRKMWQGSQCSFGSLESAIEQVDSYLKLTNCVIKGEFKSYGAIVIIDEAEGITCESHHIGNECKELSFSDVQSI